LRIEELTISAYGALARRRWELDDGLTVLFGPNEAGKTTLKSFIETVFYGFEPASERHPYLPWDAAGRSFGGEVAYVLEDGRRFRLRRFLDLSGRRAREEPTLLAGREPGSPRAAVDPADVPSEHLRQPRAIFRTVFSLSLDDLIALDQLDEDDQRDIERVFFREIAGLGLIANPRQVLEELQEQLERTKRYGGSRKRKVLIDEFEKNELARALAELKQAREDQRRAKAIQRQIDELEALQQARRRQRHELERQLQASTLRARLIELHRRRQQVREQLADFKDVERFDETLAAELEKHLERRRLRADDLARIRDELDSLETRVAEIRRCIEAGRGLLEHEGRIEELSGLADAVREIQADLASQQEQLEARKRELAGQLAELSSERDIQRSRVLSIRPEARDALLEQIEAWERRRAELVGRRSRLASQTQQLEQIDAEVEQLELALPEDMPSDFDPARLRKLEELRELVGQLALAERELDRERRQLRDEEEDLKQVREHVVELSGTARAAVPLTWLVAGFVALIFGAMATVYQMVVSHARLGAVPYAVIMLAGVVLLAHLWQRRRRVLQADELVRQSPLLQRSLMRAEAAKARVEQRRKQLDERIEELRRRWQEAGLEGHPDAKRLEQQIERLRGFDEARAEYARWRTLSAQRDELRERIESEQAQLDRLEQAEARLREAIRERFESMDLLWSDEPGAARVRVVHAGELAARWDDVRAQEQALQGKAERLRSFQQKVHALLRELDESPPEPGTEPQAVERLRGRLSQIRQNAVKLTEAEQHLQSLRKEQDELQEALDRLNEQITQCCQQLRIDGYESLQQAWERARKRQELVRQEVFLAEELARQREQIGLNRDEPLLDGRDLDATDASQVVSEDRAAIEARRAELDEQIEHTASQIDSLQQELEQISSRTSVEVAEGAVEAAYDRLAELNEQFDVLLVAHRLLDAALDEFQRNRQPQIVRRAQTYMARLTAGRYERIQADLLSEHKKLSNFEVIPGNGQSRPAECFSRGTQEQMYLALRLALADQLSAAEPLPLILDDVLVNFDDDRFEAAADLLAQISRERQILFLTCHSRTCQALASRGGKLMNL